MHMLYNSFYFLNEGTTVIYFINFDIFVSVYTCIKLQD